MTLSPSEQSELFELAGAICDGLVADEHVARLEAILSSSREARLTYARFLDLHVQIGRRLRGGEIAATRTPRLVIPTSDNESKRATSYTRRYALVATLLIAGVAVVAYLAIVGRPPAGDDRKTPAAPIASVIESTGDLLVDGEPAVSGEVYRTGTYSIDSGEAELLLTNRVSVTLSGQTSLAMHSDRSATLMRGSAKFDCPPAAKGYTVHLPGGAKVVDLGTAFSIEVAESGDASVRVTEGRVRIVTPDAAGAPGRSVELAAGQSTALTDRGRTLGPVVTTIRPVGYAYVGELQPGGAPGRLDAAGRRDDTLTELTDGVIGTGQFLDDRWVGVLNATRDPGVASPAILFDLGESRTVNTVAITYLVDHEAGIHAPGRAVVRSGDSPDALGEPVEIVGFDDAPDPPVIRVGDVRTHTLRFAPISGRYLRLDLYNDGEWTFISEVGFVADRQAPTTIDGGGDDPAAPD